MALTYVSDGDVISVAAPTGGVTAGTPFLLGSLVLIPQNTVAQTLTVDCYVTGIHKVTKADSQAWTQNVKVYWDDTNKVFTTTSTSNTLCGVAAAPVASTAGLTTGYVRLDGVAR